MKGAQKKSVEYIKHYFESGVERDNEGRKEEIKQYIEKLEAKELQAGEWVSETTERSSLVSVTVHIGQGRKGTLLSALCSQSWHFMVGSRGGIRAISYPESIEQFKGGYFMGFKIIPQGGKW